MESKKKETQSNVMTLEGFMSIIHDTKKLQGIFIDNENHDLVKNMMNQQRTALDYLNSTNTNIFKFDKFIILKDGEYIFDYSSALKEYKDYFIELFIPVVSYSNQSELEDFDRLSNNDDDNYEEDDYFDDDNADVEFEPDEDFLNRLNNNENNFKDKNVQCNTLVNNGLEIYNRCTACYVVICKNAELSATDNKNTAKKKRHRAIPYKSSVNGWIIFDIAFLESEAYFEENLSAPFSSVPLFIGILNTKKDAMQYIKKRKGCYSTIMQIKNGHPQEKSKKIFYTAKSGKLEEQ